MSAPDWTPADVRACADGLRDYIDADGIPDSYPPKLRRACQRGEWARAVFLEHSHMCRFTAHTFAILEAQRSSTSLAIDNTHQDWRAAVPRENDTDTTAGASADRIAKRAAELAPTIAAWQLETWTVRDGKEYADNAHGVPLELTPIGCAAFRLASSRAAES